MKLTNLVSLSVLAILAMPMALHAYVGPGAGLSALGALIAIVSSVVVGIFGFVWFPVKRLLRAVKKRREAKDSLQVEPT